MHLSTQDIAVKISTLPEQEQQEVVDFIEFLKVKLARQQAEHLLGHQESHPNQQTEGARVLQVLDEYGLLGCMEGSDGKLSENYKQHLWNNK